MLQVVSRDILRILTQRALYFNIVLDDVSITQLTFSREYTGAVEAKQVAQQDAERAKFIVRTPILHPQGWMMLKMLRGPTMMHLRALPVLDEHAHHAPSI